MRKPLVASLAEGGREGVQFSGAGGPESKRPLLLDYLFNLSILGYRSDLPIANLSFSFRLAHPAYHSFGSKSLINAVGWHDVEVLTLYRQAYRVVQLLHRVLNWVSNLHGMLPSFSGVMAGLQLLLA